MPIPGMVMTPFTQLTDEEIADLFEYLSTLK
jgi:cytochrome c1